MRWPSLLVLIVAACSKGPQADLPSISEARSLGAEWALINEQAASGRLNRTYVQSMHQQLREQLGSVAASLTRPESDYGNEIRLLLRQSDDAAPAQLRARVGRLEQIEDRLESA